MSWKGLTVYKFSSLPPPDEFEEGDLAYDLSAETLYARSGGAWVAIATASGGGAVTDATNIGAGSGEVFESKAGSILRFRTLKSLSPYIIISTTANEVEFDFDPSGGSGGGLVTNAVNLGGGYEVFKQKIGGTLEFRTLEDAASSSAESVIAGYGADTIRIKGIRSADDFVDITSDADDVIVDLDEERVADYISKNFRYNIFADNYWLVDGGEPAMVPLLACESIDTDIYLGTGFSPTSATVTAPNVALDNTSGSTTLDVVVFHNASSFDGRLDISGLNLRTSRSNAIIRIPPGERLMTNARYAMVLDSGTGNGAYISLHPSLSVVDTSPSASTRPAPLENPFFGVADAVVFSGSGYTRLLPQTVQYFFAPYTHSIVIIPKTPVGGVYVVSTDALLDNPDDTSITNYVKVIAPVPKSPHPILAVGGVDATADFIGRVGMPHGGGNNAKLFGSSYVNGFIAGAWVPGCFSGAVTSGDSGLWIPKMAADALEYQVRYYKTIFSIT